MAANNGSVGSPTGDKLQTTPGTFPASPAPVESQTIVSTQLSLSQAVHQRKAEYTRSHAIRIKVGTWNVASCKDTEKDLGKWFADKEGLSESLSGLRIGNEKVASSTDPSHAVEQEGVNSQKVASRPSPNGQEVGIYALGLQEIVDIGSATEALRPYSDPHPARKWKHAISEALPTGYVRIAEQQLIGIYLVIYASVAIAPNISSVSTTSVGTGLMGYMGNKGAVTARIVLEEATRLVFVNSHLSAGVEKGNLERRNWEVSQIQTRTKFDPVHDGGGVMEDFNEGIGDEDVAFWFGDLNYRLEGVPAEDVRRLLTLHTRDEYGKSNLVSVGDNSIHDTTSANTLSPKSPHDSAASSAILAEADNLDPSLDPTSLQTTLASLLTHDQLHAQMRTGMAFHDGWREGPVDFLPTYKYDVGSRDTFDSSEKRRGPSWCDRIIFRTRKDKVDHEETSQAREEAKKRDEEMKLRGVVEEVAADKAVLFDYDPDEDNVENDAKEPETYIDNPESLVTKAGFEDRLILDCYTSHQSISSSDHKPLEAVFTLDYDAVDPDLKAKVHQEVARELDKAENEGRPVVTIVMDQHRDSDISATHPEHTSPNVEGIDFGDVKFDHPKVRNLTIANTGRVPATLGFVDRSSENGQTSGATPPWLSIHFDRPSDNNNPNPGALHNYTIQPGDAANVTLTITIKDLKFVRQLNEGNEYIEDVIVLRIHNGRDYFLPVRGTWIQSAFGRSIEKLVRIPEGGVRRLQHQRPDGSSSHGEQEGVKWSAPRELFRLTEAIEELAERSVAEWSMRAEEGEAPWIRSHGWPFRGWASNKKDRVAARAAVREGLDTDAPFVKMFAPEAGSSLRLEALAETLLQFLESLEDGIIPSSLWSELENTMLEAEKSKTLLTDEEQRIRILDTLSTSPPHSVSFTFITFMLCRLADEIAPIPRRKLQRQATATSFDEMEAVIDSASDAAKARRRGVDEAYAAILWDVMIRGSEESVTTAKAAKVSEGRRRRVVEVFLREKVGEGV